MRSPPQPAPSSLRRRWTGLALTRLFAGLLAMLVAGFFWVPRTTAETAPSPAAGALAAPGNGAANTESVAACAAVAYADSASPTHQEGEAVYVVPPNPDGPTIVDIGLFVMEVTEIDAVNNTFRVEAFMDLVWCDPRLRYDSSDFAGERKVFLEEDALAEIARIWWPDVTFVNDVQSRDTENVELIIFSDGTVEYEERLNVMLAADYDLRNFPFDEHTLPIEIESFSWDDRFLQFHQETDKIGFSDEFAIPEWEIGGIRTDLVSRQEVREQSPFSEFMLEIDVVRQPGFYLWKVLLPLIMLVGISWSVFWMIGDGLSDRMGVSLTGILTVVAYQFIISDSLPRVPYFTFMDAILTLSFVLMALTIVENVVVNVLYLHDKEARAVKIDRTCRWAFPLVYACSTLMLAAYYLLHK